jgi:hypothetical protein
LPPRDFSVTSVYTEAGERLAMGKTWVTPFVGLTVSIR